MMVAMTDWLAIYKIYSMICIPFMGFCWVKVYQSWGQARKNRKPDLPDFSPIAQHFPSSYTEEGAKHLKRHYGYWLKGCAIVVTLIPWLYIAESTP